MMRAVFSALGFSLMLWGGALFHIDSVTLKADAPRNAVVDFLVSEQGSSRTVQMAPWLPYTLIGVGLVTLMYAIALPKPVPRGQGH